MNEDEFFGSYSDPDTIDKIVANDQNGSGGGLILILFCALAALFLCRPLFVGLVLLGK